MGEPSPAGGAPSELEALVSTGPGRAVLDAIMGAIPSFSVVVSAPEGEILGVSDYALQTFGATRDQVVGRTVAQMLEAIQPRDALGRAFDVDDFPLIRAMRGDTVIDIASEVKDPQGAPMFIAGAAAPIRNAQGTVIGAMSAPFDVTARNRLEAELREAAARQEALYRELAHRVKNHLNIVAGLIALETRDPEVTARVLADRIQGRIQTLAAVYDSMTRAETAGQVEALPFVQNVVRPYLSPRVAVSTSVSPEDLALSSDQAGPFGMLLNEAVCNSVKHAFPDRSGRVEVEFVREAPGRLGLSVADDGVGGVVLQHAGRVSHGIGLMRLLAQQLKGGLEIGERPGGGALVRLGMPEA
jgi:PAS domain S-box-containing protein